jgi:hypothetical protein
VNHCIVSGYIVYHPAQCPGTGYVGDDDCVGGFGVCWFVLHSSFPRLNPRCSGLTIM